MLGCLLPLLSLFVPRLVMLFIFILTNWFSKAYETVLWPLLGFFFMPYTTLCYMAAMLNNDKQLNGWWIALLILGIIFDLGQASNNTSKKNE